MQSSTAHRLLWGIVIVTIGVVFLLNQLGFVSLDIRYIISTYWPALLIVFGLQGLLLQHRGGFLWNSITVLIGCYFLGRNLGWLHWGFSDFIRILAPIAIILFGISLIFKGDRSSRSKHQDKGERWNSFDPPIPPMPPGPPPAPQELDNFENRDPIDLSKKSHGGEDSRRDSYQQSNHNGSEFDSRHHTRHYGWKQKQEFKDWWKNYEGHGSCKDSHSRFIGDAHFGTDYWELRPMNISHFIGDTTLDLTKAQISMGETRVYVSSFIGDVKVFVPNDLTVGLKVISSCLIGDVKVLDQKRGGLLNQMSVETPNYTDCDKRIVLIVNSFIGDVRVTKVG
ncbi:cell wall-active antibiotics response protein LiaF [Cohnella mopanensis]|uniref:cell wall-active antibiotics response protein LiaF n=1 Tax=Cohnella mopanensis TaxID=2911966 RepID=UPI001EF7F3CD|nr:cell wall-active antibiotics response protein LiaF [Cohnella mopanensis]